ncbi:hypothetical protein ECDEC7C_5249 [Escherichia coli DEC7C]|nr:hypothetical protein ECDEC7C_5249 [Escherichia coli DEC7C]
MVVEQGSFQGRQQWLSAAERLGFLSERVLLQGVVSENGK